MTLELVYLSHDKSHTRLAVTGDRADADVASAITSHIVDFNLFTSIRLATFA